MCNEPVDPRLYQPSLLQWKSLSKFHQVHRPSRALEQLSQSTLALEQLPPFSQSGIERTKARNISRIHIYYQSEKQVASTLEGPKIQIGAHVV